MDSYPGSYIDGQLGNFEGEFKDGKLIYSPTFAFSEDLEEITEGRVFGFDFDVYDADGEIIFTAADLNFLFVNSEEPKDTVVSAKPTASKVVVDGKQIAFEAYNIDGSNYFKLRDLAMVVNGSSRQFQVGWDSKNNAINLKTNEAYTPDGKELVVSSKLTTKQAKATQSKIYLNGEEIKLTAYNIGGNNYFKLRDIAAAIDFAVTWDAKLSTVGIDTKAGYTEPAK